MYMHALQGSSVLYNNRRYHIYARATVNLCIIINIMSISYIHPPMYLIHTLHGTYGKACTHMWIMYIILYYIYTIQTLINYIHIYTVRIRKRTMYTLFRQ